MELLTQMPYSCVLDVVHDYPDGLTDRQIGLVLGVKKQRIEVERNAAEAKYKAGMRELGVEEDDYDQ